MWSNTLMTEPRHITQVEVCSCSGGVTIHGVGPPTGHAEAGGREGDYGSPTFVQNPGDHREVLVATLRKRHDF